MSRGTGSRDEYANRAPAVRTPEERNQLIGPYIPLALSMANKAYLSGRGRRFGYDDLRQEAVVGLMRAGDLYREELGIALATYARLWIRSAISLATRPSLSVAESCGKTFPVTLWKGDGGGRTEWLAARVSCDDGRDPLRGAESVIGGRAAEILRLRRDGLTWRQIGAVFGASHETVRTWAARALEDLFRRTAA